VRQEEVDSKHEIQQMEQKKNLTWEERHPYGDISHHTFLDGFEDLPALGEVETRVVLRVMKAHLEERLGFKITDDLFTTIIKRIPYLAPARPYGMYSKLHGFVLPLKNILKAHNAVDEHWMETVSTIMKFFRIIGGGYTISEKL
jgi:hypothetical protein